MRKGKVTWKQVLALMLTAVMVLTAVPQSSMSALAAAAEQETENQEPKDVSDNQSEADPVIPPAEEPKQQPEVAGNAASGKEGIGNEETGNEGTGNETAVYDVFSGDVSDGDVSSGDVSSGDVSGGDQETGAERVNFQLSGNNYDTFTVEYVLVSGEDTPTVDKANHTIWVDKGDKLEITIHSKPGYRLDYVLMNGMEQPLQDMKNEQGAIYENVAIIEITMDENYGAWVNTREAYLGLAVGYTDDPLTKGPLQEEIAPTDGVYNVGKRNFYIYAYKGDRKCMDIDHAEILGLSKDSLSELITAQVWVAEKDDNWDFARIFIGPDLAGKSFQVALYEKAEDTTPFEIVKIKAAPATKSSKIDGVKNGVVSQEFNTLKEYTLSSRPAQNVLEPLYVIVPEVLSGEAGEDAWQYLMSQPYSDGKLTIQTADKAGKVKIALVDANAVPYGNLIDLQTCKKYQACVAEFTLDIKAPQWTQKAPTVKFSKASEDTLWLEITPPAGFKTEQPEEYCYKIVVQPKDDLERVKYLPIGQASYQFQIPYAEGGDQFDVKAQLCYIGNTGKQTPGEEDILYASKSSKILKCATRKPYLAEKITLKKLTNTIYSGQGKVAVAKIDLGKNTSYVEDDYLEAFTTANGLYASIKNGILYLEAAPEIIWGSDGTQLHVYVTANNDIRDSENLAYLKPVAAELSIKVVDGITGIYVPNDSEQTTRPVYKQKGKAVSLKLEPECDYQVFWTRSGKATYSIGYMQDNVFYENKDILGKGMLSVNNKGVLSVHKSYDPLGKHPVNPMGDNRFCVKITAADYPGNTASAVAWFEITTEKPTLGKLIFAYDDARRGVKFHGFVDQSDISLEGRLLSTVAMVKEDAVPDADGYYAFEDVIDLEYYTLTTNSKETSVQFMRSSRNKNCLYYLDMNPQIFGKKITLTATTTDGSKVTQKFSFSTHYVEKDHVGIKWDQGSNQPWEMMKPVKDQDGNSQNNYLFMNPDTGEAAGSGNPIYLKIAREKEDGTIEDGSYAWDYHISVSGAKVTDMVSEDMEGEYSFNQTLKITLTGKKATVTLKKGNKAVQTYTIVNDHFEKEVAVPKITVGKGEKLFAELNQQQELSFHMSKSLENADQVAYVRILETSLEKARVQDEPWGSSYENVFLVNSSGYIDLKLDPDQQDFCLSAEYFLDEGKRSISFVFLDKDYTPLTQQSKPVTIKVEKIKPKMKLTATKYTLSAEDAMEVPLKCETQHVREILCVELLNDIQKGQANNFTTYFEVDKDSMTLRLKPGITDLPSKKDLTGYVLIAAEYEDGSSVTIAPKITVNLKKGYTKKYKADPIKVDHDNVDLKDAMPVTIRANGEEVPVYAVYVETAAKDPAVTAKVDQDEVLLQISDISKRKNQKVTLYVIPKNSKAALNNTVLTEEEIKAQGVKIVLNLTCDVVM